MKTQCGFTLAEMAVVVFIMGIAMSMGLKMTNANLDNSAYSTTKAKQERIKIALIGYLRSNGVLPCPDNIPEISKGVAAGSCSASAQGYGVVPWQTLGLSRDAVQDGWGNLFSYRVANFREADSKSFTPPPQTPLLKNTNQNWTIKSGTGAFDIVSLSDATTSPGYQTFLIQSKRPAGPY